MNSSGPLGIKKEITDPSLQLDVTKYFYHSVTGCNLDKLMSILAQGILSKDAGGSSFQSSGYGINGSEYISVATHTVLNCAYYSGESLGVIIEPKDLFLRGSAFYDEDQLPFEKLVHLKIPKENIVGITVPPSYMSKDISFSNLFNLYNTPLLKIGMESLEHFYQTTLNVSLLADQRLKQAYERALLFSKDAEDLQKQYPRAFIGDIKARELKEELDKEFNTALTERIKEIYQSIMNREKFSLVDIIRYHVKDTLPIYLTTGELIAEEKIESEGTT